MTLMKKSALVLAIGLASFSTLSNAAGLQEIYELALKNDAQLKADTAGYEAGKANETINRAGLLPQINAQYNYSDSKSTRTDNINAALSGKTNSKNTGWNISLNQTLFDLSAWYTYKQGVHLSEQAEAQFGADQQTFMVRVATAYFNVLRTVDRLEATIAEQNANAHQLEQVKQRFDVGLRQRRSSRIRSTR
jgi:outer membrane protein